MRATQRMLAAMDEDYGGQVAVLFLSEHTGEDPEGYAAMAARMEAPAALRPGSRGVDSLSAGAAGITIRHWTDAASAVAWRHHPAHSAARAAGRGSSRPHRRLNVATIDRSHGWARV